MHPIIYDVAVSIDGYISGPDGDISQFAQSGPVVDDYRDRLAGYGTAIMGAETYVFGYRYGLAPGQNPYPHMETFVFSRSLQVPADSAVTVMRDRDPTAIERIRAAARGPVYLCGGGAFAGALLSMGLIDLLRLKRAPVVIGGGVRLFGEITTAPVLRMIETRPHDSGYVYQSFAIER